MVVYQKRCDDEIARWKVRRPRYILGKELKKIHMQQCGKMGSGARPEEAVPEGHRDVTRRVPAVGICPYCGSEQGAKALPRRGLGVSSGADFSIFPTAIVLYSVLRTIEEEYITLFNTNASSQTLFRLGVVPAPPSSNK